MLSFFQQIGDVRIISNYVNGFKMASQSLDSTWRNKNNVSGLALPNVTPRYMAFLSKTMEFGDKNKTLGC